MNQIQLFGLSYQGQSGEFEREVSSTAGKSASDGFKDVFNQLIFNRSVGDSSGFPNSSQNLSQQSVYEKDAASIDVDIFNLDDEVDLESAEYELKDEVDLQEVVDELKTSSEELDSEKVDVLVDKVKDLLKDPEHAKAVLDVLEKSGVNLNHLNEIELKKTLAALPHGAREDLIKILEIKSEEVTPLTLAQAISQALGELSDELNRDNQQSEVTEDQVDVDLEAADETLDDMLQKARVTKIDSDDEQVLDSVKSDHSESEQEESQEDLDQNNQSQQNQQQSALVNSLAAQVGQTVQAAVAQNTVVNSNATNDGPTQQVAAASKASAKDARNVKVPTSNTTPRTSIATKAEQAQMMRKILARAVMFKDNSGDVKFSVRLEPSELGNVRVSFHHSKEGTLNALIVTETDASRQILQANVNELKAALTEQGVKIESVQVTVDQRHGGGSQSHHSHERQRRESAKNIVAAERRREQKEVEQVQSDDVTPVDNLISVNA